MPVANAEARGRSSATGEVDCKVEARSRAATGQKVGSRAINLKLMLKSAFKPG